MEEYEAAQGARPDCVTGARMGNSVLVVSGYFKEGHGSHRRR